MIQVPHNKAHVGLHEPCLHNIDRRKVHKKWTIFILLLGIFGKSNHFTSMKNHNSFMLCTFDLLNTHTHDKKYHPDNRLNQRWIKPIEYDNSFSQ